MPKPELTFFTELAPDALTDLFKGHLVIDGLKDLNASLSLGVLDLSDKRAKIVKHLNKAGISVIAWLLLPEEEGYWFNIDNYVQAAARYAAFKAWTSHHNLAWAGIGLDIEPDINEVQQWVSQKQTQKLISTLFHRYVDKKRVVRAQGAYQALIDLIHSDGYTVESYHLPLISEERRGQSTVLQRTAGLVNVHTDREVLMLYTSFLRPDGDAVLWSYAPEADSVGVGSTGGGVDIADLKDIEPLGWEEFARDLRLCVRLEKPVHIFSLEGCVDQGFLSKLSTFDWGKPVEIPKGIHKVRRIRTGMAAFLWLLERPWVILISLTALIGWRGLCKRKKQN